jgi:Mitochondrial carrier protein
MQTQQGTEGAISTFTRTIRNEGFLAVYKGVTSPLVGMMFETAVLFVGMMSDKRYVNTFLLFMVYFILKLFFYKLLFCLFLKL